MTQPTEPVYGSVDYYRSHLAGAFDVNDLHSRAIGMIAAATRDFAASTSARLQRVDCIVDLVLDLTNERLRQAPIGMDYSREEDPTPVSPARGGPVHTGAVVDGGALVDETAGLVHHLEPGSDGDSGDRVACGALVDDISSLTGNPARTDCPACLDALCGEPF
jgi:hypothetical protein